VIDGNTAVKSLEVVWSPQKDGFHLEKKPTKQQTKNPKPTRPEFVINVGFDSLSVRSYRQSFGTW